MNPVRNTKLDTLHCGRLNLIVILVHTTFTNDAVGCFILFCFVLFYWVVRLGVGVGGGESNKIG